MQKYFHSFTEDLVFRMINFYPCWKPWKRVLSLLWNNPRDALSSPAILTSNVHAVVGNVIRKGGAAQTKHQPWFHSAKFNCKITISLFLSLQHLQFTLAQFHCKLTLSRSFIFFNSHFLVLKVGKFCNESLFCSEEVDNLGNVESNVKTL